MESNKEPQKPTFGEATRFWLKLGFISFGGPAGQIAIMHEYLVDKKKWVSDSRFLHALNYCMVLPGPEAQQLATYLGWLLHGTKGGLVAGLLFIFPSLLILLGLSVVYVTYGQIPWVESIFDGLKPAVIAIVVVALIKIGKKSLLSYFHYGVAAVAFVMIFFFNIPFPLIILGALVFSFLFQNMGWISKAGEGKLKTLDEELEKSYFLNEFSPRKKSQNPRKTILWQLGIGLILWILPFLLFFGFSEQFDFWKTLGLFFTQAALVTFGGAYAVLPYVAQVSVEKFQWLDALQMLDGLALGETTPGPLIMVLVFVGFMAGYNSFDQSLMMG
ncbi:MAG TPA: chromate transporter, partial [Algoriphagus sp.]|nr:chromate transporter [Algoriphagus sp.]